MTQEIMYREISARLVRVAYPVSIYTSLLMLTVSRHSIIKYDFFLRVFLFLLNKCSSWGYIDWRYWPRMPWIYDILLVLTSVICLILATKPIFTEQWQLLKSLHAKIFFPPKKLHQFDSKCMQTFFAWLYW